MKNSDIKDVKVIYRRWILLIPFFILISGIFILYTLGPESPSIGVLGGILAFIGLLSLLILLFSILAIELSVRMMLKNKQPRVSFSEKFEKEKGLIEDNDT